MLESPGGGVTASQWLDARLPGISTTEGDDLPADTQMLVTAGPPDIHLPQLSAMLLPFAGIPKAVVEFGQANPQVRLYNLHFNAAATAEMALALLLGCARQVPRADSALRQGRWLGREGREPGILLHGKTAAILGYGAIGRHVGTVLRAMGMRVLGIRRSHPQMSDEYTVARMGDALRQAHVLVVAAPGSEETQGMIGARELSLLREPRLVVNVGRGSVIQEEALYEACRNGILAGAGLDVWYRYPRGEGPHYPSQFPFHELDNVVMSPHWGGNERNTEHARLEAVAELLERLLAGDPPQPVDPFAGY